MNQPMQGLDHLSDLSFDLREELSRTCVEGLPAEISEAVNLARIEMQTIPKALEDLYRAKQDFSTLDHAIDRLLVLSQEAADLADHDQTGREARQEEFIRLARVVARVAGQHNYDQPRLSIMTKTQAQAARMTLGYLASVKANVACQLKEQEGNIIKAVQATADFLEIIKKAYPKTVKGAVGLGRLSSSNMIPGQNALTGEVFDGGLHY
ncbi:MAG: hypothetical protein JRF41_05475 [Deltaproteobacteria bacterium]|nr:hypothetical protein [Deltaproteobacteria bacterium]MBW2322963.1 hypothetical protein [Deltaproteobacteria bacterium]